MALYEVPQPPIISKLAFRFRLTDAEYVNVLSMAKTDVEVQAWLETFNMATKINLDDPRTSNGLNTLVSKGILTEERVKQILYTSVTQEERF